MYKIIIVSDSHKHFKEGIEEYKKRLGKSIDVIELKPSKKDTVDLIKTEDTKNIIKHIESLSWYKIYLDIKGESFTTEKFAKMIAEKKQNFSNIVFIIGWVYGSTEEIYKHIDFKFSLSDLTFPHGGALLMLLEQIYRIETIFSGKSYHY